MNTPSWQKPRTISVVVDNDSWILPYATQLVDKINAGGDQANLCRNHDLIAQGLAAFYLGCVTITPKKILERNVYNLVVHESNLPKGRGFAPMTWQILDGSNTIPICLIEATEHVDAGPIYFRDEIKLEGHELASEWRDMQGQKTIDLCLKFLNQHSAPEGSPQTGEQTRYSRRKPENSELDINKTIKEQINLLRVCDNQRYPAYFMHQGRKFILTIKKERKNSE